MSIPASKPVEALDDVDRAFEAAEWRDGEPYDAKQDALVREAQGDAALLIPHDEVMRRMREHFGVE